MSKSMRMVFFGAIVLGAGIPLAVFAQPAEQPKQPEPLSIQPLITDRPLKPSGDAAGIKIEPLTVFPAITAGIGRNDNVVLSNQNRIESSYISVAPAIVAEIKDGPHTYTAGYVGQYGRYGSSSADNFDDHLVGATANLVFGSRVGLRLTAEYMKQHDPRGSTDRRAADGTLSDRPDRWHATGFDAILGFGAKDARGRLELEVSSKQKRYENNLSITQAGDLDQQYVGGVFYYRIMPKTSLLFQVSQTNFDYTLGTPNLDSTERQYLAGVTWDATAVTAGSIKVGQLEKKFKDTSLTDFKGFSWEATGRWSPRTYSHFNITSSRSTYDSTGLGNFIVTKQIALNWNHEWTPTIMSDLNFFTADDSYNGVERDDKRNGYGLKLTWKAQRWLKFAAEYDYLKRNSNIEAFDYRRSLLLFSVNVTM